MKHFIQDYILGDLLIYLLVGITLYIVIRMIYIKSKKKSLIPRKEILYLLFVIYVITILSKTVMPTWYTCTINGVSHIKILRNTPQFNFIPFRSIYYFFTTLSNDLVSFNSYLNLLANLFLLFPFGILFPMIWKKQGKKTILYGVLCSVAIEILQILPGRSTDIDDIILNSIGCAIGYGIVRVFVRNASSTART